MNRIVNRIIEKHELSKVGMIVSEALADHDRYLNQQVINYMYQQLNDPATRKAFLDRVKKYHSMSEYASDKVTSMMYEYLRYLPPEMAKNFAREFYQKEIRNGVYDNQDHDEDGNDDIVNANKWYDLAMEAGNPESSIGMFAAYSDGDFQDDLESEDIFNVLLNGNTLSREAKILLIVNLMFGTGPGMRTRARGDEEDATLGDGVDLRQILRKLPPEYIEVENKIKELKNLGFPNNKITPKSILEGDWNGNWVKELGDKGRDGQTFSPGLLGSKKKIAQKELIDKVTDLADELGLNLAGIFGESFTDDVEKGAKSKDKMFLIWLSNFLSGSKVSGSQIITIIVRAVASNLEHQTELSKKSKRFKFDSISRISREYLKLIKKGGEEHLAEVFAMVLAPVLRWKLKDRKL